MASHNRHLLLSKLLLACMRRGTDARSVESEEKPLVVLDVHHLVTLLRSGSASTLHGVLAALHYLTVGALPVSSPLLRVVCANETANAKKMGKWVRCNAFNIYSAQWEEIMVLLLGHTVNVRN